jgi:hypothetical protein
MISQVNGVYRKSPGDSLKFPAAKPRPVLTLTFGFVLDAQERGEPVGWATSTESSFFRRMRLVCLLKPSLEETYEAWREEPREAARLLDWIGNPEMWRTRQDD